MVKLLYFFKFVDLFGSSQEEIKLPDDVDNIAGLLALLGKRGEQYQSALANSAGMQITINKKFADAKSSIKQGDEIALFPKGR